MTTQRIWALAAGFLAVGLVLVSLLYTVRSDCAYTTEPPECTQDEEVATVFLGFGGYGLALIGLVFLVRAVWLELAARPAA